MRGLLFRMKQRRQFSSAVDPPAGRHRIRRPAVFALPCGLPLPEGRGHGNVFTGVAAVSGTSFPLKEGRFQTTDKVLMKCCAVLRLHARTT